MIKGITIFVVIFVIVIANIANKEEKIRIRMPENLRERPEPDLRI